MSHTPPHCTLQHYTTTKWCTETLLGPQSCCSSGSQSPPRLSGAQRHQTLGIPHPLPLTCAVHAGKKLPPCEALSQDLLCAPRTVPPSLSCHMVTVPDTAGAPPAMYPSLMLATERPANNHGCFLHNPMLKEALAWRYAGWLLALLLFHQMNLCGPSLIGSV